MADLFTNVPGTGAQRFTYTATPNIVQPAAMPYAGTEPYNLIPIGSELTGSPWSYSNATSLLRRAIAESIFDAVPKKYSMLRLLYDKPVQYRDSDVFTYMEKTFGRVALKANSGTSTANPITLHATAGGGSNVTVNKVVCFPDGTKAVVESISTDDIVLRTITGGGNLPAIVTGDYFSIVGGIIADGQNWFSHYDRMKKIERYNFIQLMQRDKRWSRKEMVKFANTGITDYFELDKKEQLDLLMVDMFVSLWNGTRGEVSIIPPGGSFSAYYKALLTGGIYPLMVSAGSANATGITKATLQDAFEQLVFQTDYKSEGGVRYIFAQNALLYELMKAYKETLVRYQPSDRTADLNLSAFQIGDMKFIPVACELFKDVSCFPVSWQNRIFVLDLDTIQPVCMKGYEPVEMGSTLNKQGGAIVDYTEWWIQGMIGLQLNNPLSSFWIDTTGIISAYTTPQNP